MKKLTAILLALCLTALLAACGAAPAAEQSAPAAPKVAATNQKTSENGTVLIRPKPSICRIW